MSDDSACKKKLVRVEGIDFDPHALASPYFALDEALFRRNLAKLKLLEEKTGARVLLALKGFAMWSAFDIAREYLSGVTCSSTAEARLGREYFDKEVHVYAPAFTDVDMAELLGAPEAALGIRPVHEPPAGAEALVDHIVFNSVAQFRKFRQRVGKAKRQGRSIEIALRLNPEHREVETALYDPCAPGSRLGIRAGDLKAAQLTDEEWSDISGLHFHNLCQKNSDALERTLAVVERNFETEIKRVAWLNLGGGHHITRPDYDFEKLTAVICEFRSRHHKEIYLEPGEATALNAGFLVAEVLDLVPSGRDAVGRLITTAILDTSATAHMPDVLEMPYRPEILGGAAPHVYEHTYRLGGLTCLAGDVVGDWSFEAPLVAGDRLVFTDMAHYTMVKTTTFNGVRHPSIAIFRQAQDGKPRELDEVRRFGYDDYRSRLS